jgi:AcrR family transcriptional regulator
LSPRADVSEERKYQILDAAEHVFASKGMSGARMDDIAEQTQLSKGTLYLYFKNKNELIIALMDRIFQREFSLLDKVDAGADQTATAALDEFVDAGIKGLTHMLRLMPIAYEFLSLAFRNSVVQRVLEQYLTRYIGTLTAIIQHGIDRGEFRQVDAQDAAIAIGAVFEGTIMLWVYDKKRINLKHHIRSGVQLLLEGIQARA